MKAEFGWIEIGGTRYDHDIVIHTDGKVSERKKKLSKSYAGKYGHTPLAAEELAFLEHERPVVVYIGTGNAGDLSLITDAITLLGANAPLVKPSPDHLPLLEGKERMYAEVLPVISCRVPGTDVRYSIAPLIMHPDPARSFTFTPRPSPV